MENLEANQQVSDRKDEVIAMAIASQHYLARKVANGCQVLVRLPNGEVEELPDRQLRKYSQKQKAD
ncbi:MAG: hypothetical protein WBB28_02070 [Crinalium sp.]